jgi:hypothetical protein
MHRKHHVSARPGRRTARRPWDQDQVLFTGAGWLDKKLVTVLMRPGVHRRLDRAQTSTPATAGGASG